MIERVDDPDIINRFANHPEINAEIGGIPFDFAPAMRETIVYLFGEHGGFCFEWTAPRTYEAHVMLTKAGRGPWGFRAAREALQQLGAERVWARVDPKARHLAYFTRRAGFAEVGSMTLYAGEKADFWRIFEWRNECPQQ